MIVTDQEQYYYLTNEQAESLPALVVQTMEGEWVPVPHDEIMEYVHELGLGAENE